MVRVRGRLEMGLLSLLAAAVVFFRRNMIRLNIAEIQLQDSGLQQAALAAFSAMSRPAAVVAATSKTKSSLSYPVLTCLQLENASTTTGSLPIIPQVVLLIGTSRSGIEPLMAWLQGIHPGAVVAAVQQPGFFEQDLAILQSHIQSPSPASLCAVQKHYVENYVLLNSKQNVSDPMSEMDRRPQHQPRTVVMDTVSLLSLTAPAVVKSVVTPTKIVAVLRNPVDRFWAHYQQQRTVDQQQGGLVDTRSVVDIINYELRVLKEQGLSTAPYLNVDDTTTAAYDDTDFLIPNSNVTTMVAMRNVTTAATAGNMLRQGMYAPLLAAWLERFPDTVRIYAHERLVATTSDNDNDTTPATRLLLDFLQLPITTVPPPPASAKVAQRVTAHEEEALSSLDEASFSDDEKAVRTYLHHFYRPYNRMLADLLQDDETWFAAWEPSDGT
jgi:hypothetical protein